MIINSKYVIQAHSLKIQKPHNLPYLDKARIYTDFFELEFD